MCWSKYRPNGSSLQKPHLNDELSSVSSHLGLPFRVYSGQGGRSPPSLLLIHFMFFLQITGMLYHHVSKNFLEIQKPLPRFQQRTSLFKFLALTNSKSN